ncbi:MAG: hypothetical protein HYX46_07535 [Betaproteobacteria bacterium]|nr:hypothetical protein [Betaproteobacteria bacterium]
MKGDFTRNTFDPAKHFSRVLMQQGRVTLDADFNEQAAILLDYMRTLAKDLIGPYAAPSAYAGFRLTFDAATKDLIIGDGRYYVDGILVENDEPVPYSLQPDFPLLAADPLAAELKAPKGTVFWAYLDVWERHVTYIEDDEIREKALNGPDTCTRAKVVWQVKALPAASLPQPNITPAGANLASCSAPLGGLMAVSRALMAARIKPGGVFKDACVTPPDSKYRGTENQLYRVEIHQSGAAGTATFKWSRENGSVASAWLGTSGNDLKVSRSTGFAAGNWVELIDDTQELMGLPGALVLLTKVEGNKLTVDPTTASPATATTWTETLVNPRVRRWDQTENDVIHLAGGAVPLTEKTASADAWIPIEDEIQIQFSPNGQYRSGDYWLIPARVSTGSIEWPPLTDANGLPVVVDGVTQPDPLPPDGVEHHYAPLGFLSLTGTTLSLGSCRCTFDPASSCFRGGSLPVGAHLVKPFNFDARLLSEEAVEESKAEAVLRKRKKPGTA